MKNFFIFCVLLCVIVAPIVGAESQWFAIDAELAEQQLIADDPLPYFKEAFTQFLYDNPVEAKYFASELNLNNGWIDYPGREDVGERLMFGRTLNSYGAKQWDGDSEVVARETARLLFGPWHTKKAYTYSTHKNLGWFPWHLNLSTGEWYKTDPRSPTLGVRVFHYTDYDHRNRTTTLGVFYNRDCEVEGYYWCRITIIRKTPSQ